MTSIDYLVIVLFSLLIFAIGLSFARNSGKDMKTFFTGVGSVPEEPNNGKRVQEAVSHLVIMNYECKSNFQIHSSERKAVKRFLQIILNIFHYMIVPDRILEVFGLSEGLVLVAVKKRA